MFGVLAARTVGGDGWVEAMESDFVWMGCKVQILHPQP